MDTFFILSNVLGEDEISRPLLLCISTRVAWAGSSIFLSAHAVAYFIS